MNPSTVEEFEKKVVISEQEGNCPEGNSFKIVAVLRRFLAVQQRRAQAYARLKRGFEDYMASGVESTYQQLCSDITVEFNDCSKQVLEMESQFLTAHCFREDLALLLRSVQNQEKMKLQLYNNNNNMPSVIHKWGLGRVECTQTLPLPRGGRESVSKRRSLK